MKVSVCIPAYKRPDGIRRLLDSILIQKYTDYDVVITDDTPGDEVKEVADEFIAKGMTSLRYVKNEERLGPSANWNHCINISTGEYVKIMHHDDCFTDENSLAEFVRMLDEDSNAVVAFCGTHQVNYETGSRYSRCISDEDLQLISEDWKNIYLGNVVGAPSAIIFRRTEEDYEGRLTWIMDMEFVMRLLRKAEREGHRRPAFACTKAPLITIGMSDTQLTEAVRDNGQINVYEYGFLYEEFELSDKYEYRKQLINIALRSDLPYESVKKYGIEKKEYDALKNEKKARDNKSNRKMIIDRIKTFDLQGIGKMCFYTGLLIEILILIIDKSAYINPVEGWMFRISFAFFALKCLCSKYSLRELLSYLFLGIIAFACYKISTRDEAVRIVVFIAAMKDMNLKRTLKFVFEFTVLGMVILAFLSLLGVLGTVFDPSEGYGIKEGTYRLCLGVGNSNALAIMIWALMTLGIYLFHNKMKNYHYIMLLDLSCVVYVATYTRTTLVVMIFTVCFAFALQKIKKLQDNKILYCAGGIGIVGCTAFSVWAAYVSDWHDNLSPLVYRLNNILTGRIEVLSRFENGGGAIANWKLFGDPNYIEYFDMGYVRLFFWYGIIPAVVAIIVLLLAVREAYRRNDYMGFMMIMVFALFTVVEAHIVSVYIARNYLLFLIGAYFSGMIYLKDKRNVK